MSDMFYRAFEERHRGSFKLIQSRLKVYLPFLEPLKKLQNTPKSLDLGCGRGEWLELMQQNGFEALGVDLDEGMLHACQERNLKAIQCNAIDYIKNLPSESLSVVSAFHLVEHISFEKLRELVEEAHRVLQPGGLLILETPNSENVLVGTSSFYLDPTHKQPIPAALLSFVVEYSKFARVKTLYLQESLHLAAGQSMGLQQVLEGVSPDYAVVSQKNAEPDVLSSFDSPFEKKYGTRLLSLTLQYDKEKQELQESVALLTTQVETLEHQIQILTNKVYLIFWLPYYLPKRLGKKFTKWMLRHVLTRPGFKKFAKKFIDKFPFIKQRLRDFAVRSGMMSASGMIKSIHPQTLTANHLEKTIHSLSPRTTQIYTELLQAIEQKEKVHENHH